MTATEARDRERELVRAAVIRLRARVMAIAFGWVGGCGLLLATAWLLVRGGPEVGKHLSLLSNYFPGYSVTWWPGALLAFCYGALLGATLGWTIASIYNRVVVLRERRT